MGIHVTVDLDVKPLTAELFFPLGLTAGTSVGIAIVVPSTSKADERKGTFSLCHAIVCGRKVPIGRSNVGRGYDTPEIPKGLQVHSPVVNGKPLCQLKNVRRETAEPSDLLPVVKLTKSARAGVVPVTTSAPDELCSTDVATADDLDEVPIGKSNVVIDCDTPDITKGLQVRPPSVNGKPSCQQQNVRKESVETSNPPPVSRPRKSAAEAVMIPVTRSAPDESSCADIVIADDPDECKKAIEDIIKTSEPSTRNVFECTECSHWTFDKEEAVKHCNSHLVSNRSKSASKKIATRAAKSGVRKRGRPAKERLGCSLCSKSFLSEERLQAHLRGHFIRSSMKPSVSAVMKGNEIQPRGDSAKCAPNSVPDNSRSSSPLTWPRHIPDDVFSDDSTKIRGNQTYPCVKCAESFASVTELDNHRLSVHQGSHFCHLCSEVFNDPISLESHVTAAHGKGICFYCTLCLMVFVGKESYNSHKAECGVVCATSKQRRKEFICSHCSFITDTYAKLCDHVADKHPSVPVQRCEECHKPFLHGAMLQHHCATVHLKSSEEVTQGNKKAAIRLYPCAFCDRVFKSHNGLRTHTNMHKNFRPYECHKCGASLSSLTNLKAHMVCIHGNPGDNAKCPHCPKVFKLMRSLKIHIRTIHSQESPKQCPLCGKQLSTERKVQLHMALTHYGDALNCEDNAFPLLRPLKCEQCDYKTFSYARLTRHRVSHTGVYKHQCPECSKHFVFRDQMTRHIQDVHRKMHFKCPDCPRSFYSEKLFQHHLDAHRLGQGFPCTICNKFFETKAAYDHHSQSHDMDLPYQCDVCRRRFKYPQGLSVHQRYQHGRNARQWNVGDHTWLHSCDVCHVRFKYQSSLAAHRLNRHTDTERLTCPYCNRSFKSQGVLSLHIRAHTGEKPYVCPHCCKAFNIPSNLKNHIITRHTKEFKFFCALCSKGMVSQEKLKRHLLHAHKAVNSSTSKLRRTAPKTGPTMPEVQELTLTEVTLEDAASILAQLMT